jgi:prepilin-type processing-associated H-X9-DG protein
LSLDFSAKVYEKLQKYKEKLVLSVTQSKMLEEIKKEVDDLDQQIKEFFKPLFNAHQNRTNYSFVDPDPFCLGIAERLLKNMTILDNKMD